MSLHKQQTPNIQGQKRGPRTKEEGGPHNEKIEEIGKRIVDEGGIILEGGGIKPEKLTKTPGGHKDGRRLDIKYKDKDGNIKGINVGKTDRYGNPVPREVEALEDLNGPGGIDSTFEPYDI